MLLGHVDYEGHWKIATNNRWVTKPMNNIAPVPPEEQVLCALTDSPQKKMMLKSEQKSVEWTMDLACKLWNTVDLVLDTCTATLATARACSQLSEHRHFVGCEKDFAFFQDLFLSLVEVYAKAGFESRL